MKKTAGRPTELHKHLLSLSDHPEIVDLYVRIAQLRNHPGWSQCHVYDGAHKGKQPVLKVNGRPVDMAQFFANHLNLPKGRKQCATPFCFNPHHYHPTPDFLPESIPTLSVDSDGGIKDLIDYIIDSRAIPKHLLTFDILRSHLPPEEVTDDQLNNYLNLSL